MRGGLMRMLMMFGPMIFRQFQKYQRNKQRRAPQQRFPQNDNRQYSGRSRDDRYRDDRYRDDRERNYRADDRQRDNRSYREDDRSRDRGYAERDRREDHRNQRVEEKQYRDLNKELNAKGAVSQDDKNFKLSEEDIMLSKDDLKHYEAANQSIEELDIDVDSSVAKETKPKSDDDLDMEDLFLNEEDIS